MGNLITSCLRRNRLNRRIVLLLIGLDNAGKTLTVNNLAGQESREVLPTVGFKAVNLVHKKVPVTIYDLGGGPNFRQIWPQYYSEVYGVIFVIDSSDLTRLDECKAVLEAVLSHENISGKPILILANKQDKTDALDDLDIVDKLNIEAVVNKYRCPTLVESHTATWHPNESRWKKRTIDPGLRKGYLWLLNYILRKYDLLKLRVDSELHADEEKRKEETAELHKKLEDKRKSEEIVVERVTGFENPNYTLTRPKSEIPLPERGVIVVKPINIEEVDNNANDNVRKNEERLSGRPRKLSPLLGRTDNPFSLSDCNTHNHVLNNSRGKTNENNITSRVRSGFTTGVIEEIKTFQRPKSSPSTAFLNSMNTSNIVPDKSKNIDEYNKEEFIQEILGDSVNVPTKCSPVKNDISFVKEKIGDIEIEDISESTVSSTQSRVVQVHLGDGVGNDGNHNKVEYLLHENTGSVQLKNKLLHFDKKDEYTVGPTKSETMLKPVPSSETNSMKLDVPIQRPASASQTVRKQLEILGSAPQRRRLSIKYGRRNKTSPEKLGIFHYDPANKGNLKILGQGDFENAQEMNFMKARTIN